MQLANRGLIVTRQESASKLAGAAAVALILTAAIHATGLPRFDRLAAEAGGALAVFVPLLWIAFSIDLVALGIIAAIIAARPGPYGRLVLLTLALPPLAAAMLQVLYLGFILPTAILLLDTVLLVAAAIATPWSTATPSA